MLLKREPGRGPFYRSLSASRAVLAALAVALAAAFFILGAYAHKTFFFRDILKPVIAENVRIPINFIDGFFASPEALTIDIKHRNYLKLAYARKQALEAGVLMPGVSEFVPALVSHRGTAYPAKVRIKGFLPDHWSADVGWSLRVRLSGDAALFGMKEFSVQHPRTRNYLNEWVFQRLLRYNGVLGLRYDFISLTENGRHLGVYAIEEGIDKRLVEAAGRREGPVIRFNEDLHWFDLESTHPQQTYVTSDIDTFQSRSSRLDAAMAERFSRAKNLLESYREGLLPAHKVFDTDKMARFFALLDLINNPHPAEYHNVSFYYNPITGLLEPLGRDGDAYYPGLPDVTYLIGSARPYGMTWEERLIGDPVFAEKYMAALKEISTEGYLDRFFADIATDYRRVLGMLHKSYPVYSFEGDKKIMYGNQAYLRTVLRPPKGIQPYFRSYDPRSRALVLEIANIQAVPVRLGPASAGGRSLPLARPVLLPGKPNGAMPGYVEASFRVPDGLLWSTMTVHELSASYELAGTGDARSERVFPWPHRDASFPASDPLLAMDRPVGFPFLSTQPDGRRIVVRPGVWKISRDLVVPAGREFVIGPGTELVLSNSASIISRSPLRWLGSAEHPVVVRSDGSGGGVIVLGDGKGASALQNVFFKGLAVPSKPGWGLTGAVNIHRSPISIRSCVFAANRDGDDSLNLIHSSFTILQTRFSRSYGDAIDLDFSDGRIMDSDFANCGVGDGNGDCMDFSGSRVELLDVRVDGSSDKGLSVGELSRVSARRLSVRHANIGVTAKDLAELVIEDSSIEDSPVGLATYRKKAEFGPSRVQALRLSLVRVERPYLLEDHSSVIVDGALIQAAARDALLTLYGEARTKRVK